MTVAETAARPVVSKATIRRYLAMGLLNGVKDGRRWVISEDSVRMFRRTYKGEVPPEERGA